eukprot:m.214096 g.214096  ORF g.214096 m.214096 type:complete len:379 (+) comp15095_c0_seq4:70-1206(+)
MPTMTNSCGAITWVTACVGLVLCVTLAHAAPAAGSCSLEKSLQLKRVLKQMEEYDERVSQLRRTGQAPFNMEPRTKYAFYKTHKTASTTTGAVFFRYAKHANLAVPNLPHVVGKARVNKYQQTDTKEADVVLQHLTRRGADMTPSLFKSSLRFYEHFLRTKNFAFVANIRNPMSHLLSFYGYYLEPDGKVSWAKYLQDPYYDDIMAREFGLEHASDVLTTLATLGDRMEFIIVERLYESLVVFALRNNWPLRYLIATHALERTENARRWDGKLLKPSKPFQEFSEQEKRRMLEKVTVDTALYEEALIQLKQRAEAYGKVVPEGSALVEEASRVLSELCACDGLDEATRDVCKWYQQTDTEYEHHLKDPIPTSPLIPIA